MPLRRPVPPPRWTFPALVDLRRGYRCGRRSGVAGHALPTWSAQYNNIITQITTTAQDASFNGINLLNGDTLKLTFNETGNPR